MVRYDTRILNRLLDSYENSLLSRGENKVKIHIGFLFTKATMPEYFNESSMDYEEIHEAVKELERKGFLAIQWRKGKEGHIIQKVLLREEKADEVYGYLKRTPKADHITMQLKLLEERMKQCEETSVTGAWIRYLIQRIRDGKSVKEFIDLSDYEKTKQLLSALAFVEENQEPSYIREFSIGHFGDSKVFEGMLGTIGKVFRRFRPEFADMDQEKILAEYGIYSTPDYVYFKGEGQLRFDRGAPGLALSALEQGIGISGSDIGNIQILGEERIYRVVTIENLTTFFRWKEEHSLIIYLGGYHNSVRRELLCRVYQAIPDAEYLHFGDIDVGGFEIYRDLCSKTGIPFRPYHMGIKELKTYERYTKQLTENDRRRLDRLMESLQKEDRRGYDQEILEVLEFMKAHGVKLEQEAIRG